MAYLNVAELPGAGLKVTARAPVEAAKPSLSALEWSVVALAERDTLSSLRAPGRLAVALAAIFGTSPSNRLADERLEALRRVAVHAWHHGFAVPELEMNALFGAGFSPAQFELIVASVSRARAGRRPRRSSVGNDSLAGLRRDVILHAQA